MQMLLNNRYQVIRTLGSGGFGDTFLAEDTQMPSLRRCVIKQLKPIHHNPQIYQLVQERFQREAAILEELGGSCDQIPALYAYFQLNGQFYLVQEWIEGDTLTSKVQQQGALSENTVREIFISLLPVLEYVHSKHIVHRDIKPDNIILRHRDGKPVLIDFGAVRETMGTVMNSQGSPTSSIVIGTPGYMPSEQAAGRPVYSSDLYSLGITAIYLLTGKQPQQLATNSQTGEMVWRQYAPHVSLTMATVIDRAIAYHPRDRFSTATEMLNALQNAGNRPSTNSHKRILVGSLIIGTLVGGSVLTSLMLTPSPPSEQPQSSMTPIAIPSQTTNIPNPTPTPTQSTTASQTTNIPNPTPTPTQSTTASQTIVPIPTPQWIPTDDSDYSWLSSRPVTDSDLDGKDSFTLDIMRNAIFARHGRRFQTPGLQNYFNRQPWYSAKYSPDEFDQLNLLSPLEKKNVEYIAAYQDRYNLRYFKK